jgi:hypothetical protein
MYVLAAVSKGVWFGRQVALWWAAEIPYIGEYSVMYMLLYIRTKHTPSILLIHKIIKRKNGK